MGTRTSDEQTRSDRPSTTSYRSGRTDSNTSTQSSVQNDHRTERGYDENSQRGRLTRGRYRTPLSGLSTDRSYGLEPNSYTPNEGDMDRYRESRTNDRYESGRYEHSRFGQGDPHSYGQRDGDHDRYYGNRGSDSYRRGEQQHSYRNDRNADFHSERREYSDRDQRGGYRNEYTGYGNSDRSQQRGYRNSESDQRGSYGSQERGYGYRSNGNDQDYRNQGFDQRRDGYRGQDSSRHDSGDYGENQRMQHRDGYERYDTNDENYDRGRNHWNNDRYPTNEDRRNDRFQNEDRYGQQERSYDRY